MCPLPLWWQDKVEKRTQGLHQDRPGTGYRKLPALEACRLLESTPINILMISWKDLPATPPMPVGLREARELKWTHHWPAQHPHCPRHFSAHSYPPLQLRPLEPGIFPCIGFELTSLFQL